MEFLATFLKVIGIGVAAVLSVAATIFFGFYILIFLVGLLSILLVAWGVGVPISIKENGVKTGYIRWFTYHVVKDGNTP